MTGEEEQEELTGEEQQQQQAGGGGGGAAAAAAAAAAAGGGGGGGSTRRYCSAPPGSSSRSCWRCQEALQEQEEQQQQPAFLCGRCGAVQPADQTASHFRTLGCDPSFSLDTQKLQKRYLQLQRSLHPDNFSQSTKEEQEYSEQQSAMLNTAYRTLLKPLSRGLYMLELQGMPIEEGTISAADPALLMELMEVNEAVEEARTVEEAGRIGQDTRVKLAELTAQIDGALRRGAAGRKLRSGRV
ncbi:hypothetical protein CRUP_024194 [Coryphaenoides rupestris]|nr:hypothetical protein CRUP_024194 [Coryphaenoides rupestris]